MLPSWFYTANELCHTSRTTFCIWRSKQHILMIYIKVIIWPPQILVAQLDKFWDLIVLSESFIIQLDFCNKFYNFKYINLKIKIKSSVFLLSIPNLTLKKLKGSPFCERSVSIFATFGSSIYHLQWWYLFFWIKDLRYQVWWILLL